jgi:hypothetical protein
METAAVLAAIGLLLEIPVKRCDSTAGLAARKLQGRNRGDFAGFRTLERLLL